MRCDSCDKRLEEGDEYNEVLVAKRAVGEPPPVYAAKFTLCDICTDTMLESF